MCNEEEREREKTAEKRKLQSGKELHNCHHIIPNNTQHGTVSKCSSQSGLLLTD